MDANIFSFRRFIALLRQDYANNLPAWIGVPLAMFAAIAVGGYVSLLGGDNAADYMRSLSAMVSGMGILMMAAMALMMFSKLKGRARAAVYLTLPASHLEKFLACMVETVVAPFVQGAIGVFAAYALLWATLQPMFAGEQFSLPLMLSYVADSALTDIAAMLWVQSVVAMCNVHWSLGKRATAIGIFLAVCIIEPGRHFLDPESAIFTYVALGLTVVHYAITYVLFSKSRL